jgi:hygromycin-B 4-O-kinase
MMESLRPSLGPADVLLFVNGLYGSGAHDVEVLPGGEWSAAFSFMLDEVELVARFSARLDDFEKDRVAAAFSRSELPVPSLLDLGESPYGYYAISERKHGVFLEDLDESGWRRALPQLFAALDSMRMTEAESTSGCHLADDGSEPVTWREWLLSGITDEPGGRVSGWQKRLSGSPELEALFAEGRAVLVSLLVSLPEKRSLVHGDLVNRNVLVEPDGSVIVAIFDWGCGVFGDYLFDVAWLDFWSPWFPALQAVGFLGALQSHYRLISHHAHDFAPRLKAYELHIALSHLAYNAFTGRDDEQTPLSVRMRQVLDST